MVSVSSSAHLRSPVVFEDIHFLERPYEPWAAYGQSKTANVLLDGIGGRYFEDCNEAGRSQPGSRRGVAAYALDPDSAALLWQVSVNTLTD